MTRLNRLAALTLFGSISVSAGASPVNVQVLDLAGKPVTDAVVYADAAPGTPLPASSAQKQAEIEQRGLKFLPLVSVIQAGSRVAFPNNDKVKHHIYSFSPAKKFDQKLYSGAAAGVQVFDKAGTVVLGCNIHDRMVAYVKVLDTPIFGKTDTSGNVHLELPAAGKFVIKVWHYNAKTDAPLEQAPAAAMTFKLAMKPPVTDTPVGEPAY
jgi:plastocyanin